MERLTERVGKEIRVIQAANQKATNVDYKAKSASEIIADAIAKLADYEDAEEEGRLIVLPYKIGATLYETAVHCENPENLVCNHSSDCFKCEDAEMFVCDFKVSTIDQAVVLMRYFGKTLFATPEEAEVKLKEMENNK